MDTIQQSNNKKIKIIFISAIILFIFLGFVFLSSFKLGLLIFIFIFFNFLFLFSGKLSLNNAIFLLLFLSILFPPIYFKSIPALRLELFLILIAWILLILGKLTNKNDIIIMSTSINKWFFFFGGSIMISIMWAFIIKGNFPIWRDFFEIIKLIEYFLIFLLMINLKIKKEDFKKYYFLVIFILLSSAILGFIQYFNVFNINKTISLYYAPTQIEGLLVYKRITGSTANPNDFSLLMVIGALFSLVGILWNKKIEIKLLLFILFFIFSYSIILTLSRSGLVCLMGGILFILLIKYSREFNLIERTKKLLTISFILLILILLFISIAPKDLFPRIKLAINLSPEGSLYDRTIKWKNAIELWKQSPIFGLGPEKNIEHSNVDNEWLLILKRYGLLGLTIFFIWSLKLYKGIEKIKNNNKNYLFLKIFSISTEASLIAIGIYMVPAGFYHFLQGMPILMIIIGLIYSHGNLKKIKLKS